MDNNHNSNKTFLAVGVLVVIAVVFLGFSRMSNNSQKAASIIGVGGNNSGRITEQRNDSMNEDMMDENGNYIKSSAIPCAITVTSDPSTQSTTSLPGVGMQEIARFVAVNPCVDDVVLDKVDYMYIQSGNTWGIRNAYLSDGTNSSVAVPSPLYVGFTSQFHFDVNNALVVPANSTQTFVVIGEVHDEPLNGGPTWSGPLDQAQMLAINMTAFDVNGPVSVLGSPALQTYTH